MLKRWLQARGYDKSIKELDSLDTSNTMVELARIFKKEVDKTTLLSCIEDISYFDIRDKQLKNHKELGFKEDIVLQDYMNDFNNLVKDIESKSIICDVAFLKSALRQIEDRFMPIFNNFEIINRFIKNSPPFIYFMLSSDKLKQKVLVNSLVLPYADPIINGVRLNQSHPIYLFFKAKIENLKSHIKESLYSTIKEEKEKGVKSDDDIIWMYVNKLIKWHQGPTEGVWKDLEDKEQKVMVISIPPSTSVKGEDEKSTAETSYNNIHNKYKIFNGVSFKSGSNNTIIY